MKKAISIAVLCFGVAACSNSQLAQINTTLNTYDNAINNFNAAVARINTSIVLTSATLAQYCSAAKQVGNNLVTIVQGNQTALIGLNTATGGINQYCAAPPQDVQSAVVQMTAIVAAAQASYLQAKAGK